MGLLMQQPMMPEQASADSSPTSPTHTTHLWAHDKPKVQRRIAALELYGTMLLFILLARQQQLKQTWFTSTNTLRGQQSQTPEVAQGPSSLPDTMINIYIPMMTDNQGNAFSILNHNTKKWPCSAILMELCAQAHVLGCHPAVQHVRRESDVWADELSNLEVDGFNPSLRIDIARYEAESLIALPRLFTLAKLDKVHTSNLGCPGRQ